MSEPKLDSYAEKHALNATKYEGFGINLPEVKRTVSHLLSQIGTHGFFAEYTKHDISHIDEVIRLTDWLVDDGTRAIMTDADWFLITLSIYFHDMGMLVTRDEFKDRDKSGFPSFCDDILFKGVRSEEYKSKLAALGNDEREIFLYQEFVRYNHAKRVRQWIEGTIDPKYGIAKAATAEVKRILKDLDPTLRRDLGLIAESHHLDDLDDLTKYKLIQPYGSTDAETANIQYCAVILRAADLLHMRRDRTPSVLFRIINPIDPISQREWAKQEAVRRVMPRLGLNNEQIPDVKAPKDTIEVHATFTEEDGFFGLTSFLGYASKQVRQCNEWIETSKKIGGSKYSFIWKRVADDKVETEGFMPKTYYFDIDQQKILDLLIGHTLYNDTGVVLRELAQNGIDAIRLDKNQADKNNRKIEAGELKVTWDSQERVLTVADNGTGMTQEIIEKHLLKVGSSRYQDPKFLEVNPDFSAISRFGIGVLTTFMVSDEVEITTASREDEKARKISLRSVHGRYLVRLLDKTHPDALATGDHGTQVRLKLRATAKLSAIGDILRHWVVLPRCKVTYSADGAAPVIVGYESPADAVQAYLDEAGYKTDGARPEYKVFTKQIDGVELAYAGKWSPFYRDWAIAHTRELQKPIPVPCTCIEGIAVVFSTPGMHTPSFIAIANGTGHGAPKTNVARSTLESTPERDAMYSSFYDLYVEHVKDEITRLTTEESYSVTWAANNAINLVPFSFSGRNEAALPGKLKESMKTIPVFIVEYDGKRLNIPFVDLLNHKVFWTVDCNLLNSAEDLVREATANATVSNVISALGDNAQKLPDGVVLYNLDVNGALRESVESEFEPELIRCDEGLRRVDIRWGARVGDRWLKIEDLLKKSSTFFSTQRGAQFLDWVENRFRRDDRRAGANVRGLWLPSSDVVFEGIDGYAGIYSFYRTFLRGDLEITKMLRRLVSDTQDDDAIKRAQIYSALCLAAMESPDPVNFVASQLKQLSGDLELLVEPNKAEFMDLVAKTPMRLFNTSVWRSRIFGGRGDFR